MRISCVNNKAICLLYSGMIASYLAGNWTFPLFPRKMQVQLTSKIRPPEYDEPRTCFVKRGVGCILGLQQCITREQKKGDTAEQKKQDGLQD